MGGTYTLHAGPPASLYRHIRYDTYYNIIL
jgi:hypothetical protein